MPRKQQQPNQMQESKLHCQPRTWACRQRISLLFLGMTCFEKFLWTSSPFHWGQVQQMQLGCAQFASVHIPCAAPSIYLCTSQPLTEERRKPIARNYLKKKVKNWKGRTLREKMGSYAKKSLLALRVKNLSHLSTRVCSPKSMGITKGSTSE